MRDEPFWGARLQAQTPPHCLGLRRAILGSSVLGAKLPPLGVILTMSVGSAGSLISAPRASSCIWATAVLRSLAAQWSLL